MKSGSWFRFLLTLAVIFWCLALLMPGWLGDNFRLASGFVLFFAMVWGIGPGFRFLLQGPPVNERPRLRPGQRLQSPTLWNRLRLPAVYGTLLLVVTGNELHVSVAAGLVCLAMVMLAYELIRPGDNIDRGLIAARLAGLLRLHMSLGDALETVFRQMESRWLNRFGRVRQQLAYLIFDVRAGSQLSAAVSAQDDFPALWPALIALGERTDTVPESLDDIARLELMPGHRADFVVQLLTLPLLGGLIWLMTEVVLPTFYAVIHLAPEQEAVWATTRTLLTWSGAFLVYGCLGVLAYWVFARANKAGPAALDLLSFLPPYGTPTRVLQEGLVARAWLAGARRQRPVGELVELSRDVVTNRLYKRALNPDKVAAGDSLSTLLERHPRLFSEEFRWLVKQGEQGDLTAALELALSALEEKLPDVRSRAHLQFGVAVQIGTGLLVALLAVHFWYPFAMMTGQTVGEGMLP